MLELQVAILSVHIKQSRMPCLALSWVLSKAHPTVQKQTPRLSTWTLNPD